MSDVLTAGRLIADSALPSAVAETHTVLGRLGVDSAVFTDGAIVARSPITGEVVGRLDRPPAAAGTKAAVERAHAAFPGLAQGPPLPAAASWCGCSARNCAPPRRTSAASSPWRPARSPPRASARSRR
ncbi:MAG: hypothetical protein WDM85_18350 [Caulobacteraceae bacterium]